MLPVEMVTATCRMPSVYEIGTNAIVMGPFLVGLMAIFWIYGIKPNGLFRRPEGQLSVLILLILAGYEALDRGIRAADQWLARSHYCALIKSGHAAVASASLLFLTCALALTAFWLHRAEPELSEMPVLRDLTRGHLSNFFLSILAADVSLLVATFDNRMAAQVWVPVVMSVAFTWAFAQWPWFEESNAKAFRRGDSGRSEDV